jgi:hypothetical protein
LALTEMQKAQVNKLLTAYCAKRVPPAVRSKVRVGYRIEGNAVILYEERPAFRPPHDWQEMVIAKFTYISTNGDSTANIAIFAGTATKRCQRPRAWPSYSTRSTLIQRESSGDDIVAGLSNFALHRTGARVARAGRR